MGILVVAAAAVGGAGCKGGASTSVDGGSKAVVLYREGVGQFNENHIDAGIQTLRKAYDLNPTQPLIRQDLGRMLLVRGVREDLASIQMSAESRDLHSQSKHEEANRKQDEANANHRTALNDFREAQGHFLYLIDAMPEEPNVPYFLAQVEMGLGHYKEARKNLKRAIDMGGASGPELDRLQRTVELLEQAQLQEEHLNKKS